MKAEQAIFIEWDAKGYGTEKPEYTDLHSIFGLVHEREIEVYPSDEVVRLLQDPANDWMRNAAPQIKKLLATKDFPWRYIQYAANVGGKGFDTEEDIRNWLKTIFKLIEENLQAEAPK